MASARAYMVKRNDRITHTYTKMQGYIQKNQYLTSGKLTGSLSFWMMAWLECNKMPLLSGHLADQPMQEMALHWPSGWGIRGSSNSQNEVQPLMPMLLQGSIRTDLGVALGRAPATATKTKHVLGDVAWLFYLVTENTVSCLLKSGHSSARSGSVRVALSPGWWEICSLKTESSGEFYCF